ncbi:MAG: DNA-processing protein DprA [Rudaea sp.]
MALDARSLAWARLAGKPLPQRVLVSLLRHFGDPQALLAASRPALSRILSPAGADAVLAPEDEDTLARTSRWLDDPGHHVVAWDDDDFPRALLEVGDAPPAFFYIGRRELLGRAALGIVGSRHATPQGTENAREFAHALGAAGLTIVSGLALGIDAAAHEGALGTAGSTIAVIGTGPDRVYPARNRDLAARIARDGGIVSEFVPGTPPRKENFPRRNRLISGLSRGVLVVEATLSSGSLITARLAGEQGREVFAIPGSIHSPFAKGCHKLIREGAKLVETAQDVLAELHLASAAPPAAQGRTGEDASTAPLLTAMGYDPVGVDVLVARTGLAAESIMRDLVTLELAGDIAALPGGLWQRRPRGRRSA